MGDTLSVPGLNKVPASTITTKHGVLHSVARTVDQLGFLSSIMIHGKLLLQKLWVANQSWDEPISPELMSEWSQVLQLLIEITGLKIPRL